jgi:hypothetical protein
MRLSRIVLFASMLVSGGLVVVGAPRLAAAQEKPNPCTCFLFFCVCQDSGNVPDIGAIGGPGPVGGGAPMGGGGGAGGGWSSSGGWSNGSGSGGVHEPPPPQARKTVSADVAGVRASMIDPADAARGASGISRLAPLNAGSPLCLSRSREASLAAEVYADRSTASQFADVAAGALKQLAGSALTGLLRDGCQQSFQPGSIIQCENQVLGEVIPVAGTGMGLVYSSARVPGFT